MTPAPVKTAQQRGRMSRSKGQAGEREVAHLLLGLTGLDVRRRVRQHEGDSDIEYPGWAVECKRYASVTHAALAVWWRQACVQAHKANLRPVLFFRGDRCEWQVVWHAGHHTPAIPWHMNGDLRDTLTASPETWWRMTKHLKAHAVD